METAAVLPLVCQIALLLERLAEVGRLFGGIRQGMYLCEIVWKRMLGFQRRFERLAARIKAGTVRPPRQRRVRADAPERVRAGGKSPLPRYFGWMPQMVPGAGVVKQAFELMLADPELPALMAMAPQTGRILRPICRILGLELPPGLALPKRERARKKEPPPPHPDAARFPDTRAARSAARALARMQAGLPVDVKKLSRVAYGYFVHPPRNEHCPPPEIGYARPRPLPRDYDPPSEDWD